MSVLNEMINNMDKAMISVIQQQPTIHTNHFTHIIFILYKNPKKNTYNFYHVTGEKSNAQRIKCQNQNSSQSYTYSCLVATPLTITI